VPAELPPDTKSKLTWQPRPVAAALTTLHRPAATGDSTFVHGHSHEVPTVVIPGHMLSSTGMCCHPWVYAAIHGHMPVHGYSLIVPIAVIHGQHWCQGPVPQVDTQLTPAQHKVTVQRRHSAALCEGASSGQCSTVPEQRWNCTVQHGDSAAHMRRDYPAPSSAQLCHRT
jgi:hypothetical protein